MNRVVGAARLHLLGYQNVLVPWSVLASALVINLLLVVYLVWSKRLFGARGGKEAYEARLRTESFIEVEQAALLGHIDDAVNLYVKFTDVDPELARQVVERLAQG